MSPSEDQKKKPVGFRFDPDLERYLQLVSDRSGIKKTVIVEESLAFYFGDRSDPMHERRRDFVLAVIQDLVGEGQLPGHYAPEGRRPATRGRAGVAAGEPLGGAVTDAVSPAKAASSGPGKKGRKGPSEASKHAQRMIAARLKRRSGAQ